MSFSEKLLKKRAGDFSSARFFILARVFRLSGEVIICAAKKRTKKGRPDACPAGSLRFSP
ncbi:hypothetical protein [Methylophaga sp. OBS1]|uniref:hypothetical protein n=1 Tax=Methylophaga sp. OBS1 TaxID=2991933 RepID=UPI002251A232|nr:hypothetical protein [Methylophaga sp. OBS1]MCX4193050.1 hypothetical protein [Methylophaga sp. OBS1]